MKYTTSVRHTPPDVTLLSVSQTLVEILPSDWTLCVNQCLLIRSIRTIDHNNVRTDSAHNHTQLGVRTVRHRFYVNGRTWRFQSFHRLFHNWCSRVFPQCTKLAILEFLQLSVCPRRGGRAWQWGMCVVGGHAWQGPPTRYYEIGWYGQWAGGTHSTGTHSCCYLNLKNKFDHFNFDSNHYDKRKFALGSLTVYSIFISMRTRKYTSRMRTARLATVPVLFLGLPLGVSNGGLLFQVPCSEGTHPPLDILTPKTYLHPSGILAPLWTEPPPGILIPPPSEIPTLLWTEWQTPRKTLLSQQ